MTDTTKKYDLISQAKLAKFSSKNLANLSTNEKNSILSKISENLKYYTNEILIENQKDISIAKNNGMEFHTIERMILDSNRIKDMINGIKNIINLEDPIGKTIEEKILPNGLSLRRVRVPLGVIGVIYESRPNVTIDIASLCIKSGNSTILRGGKECINTNIFLHKIIQDSIEILGFDKNYVQLIQSTDRSLVREMLSLENFIDYMIPRGSENLVKFVSENAKMPAVTGGVGVCHTYVDEFANIQTGIDVVINAKTQRYTVCNAMDTLLIHEKIAKKFLSKLVPLLEKHSVEIRADEKSFELIQSMGSKNNLTKASKDDFGKEFLDLILSIKIVKNLDDSINHIDNYGSQHSEAIISENVDNLEKFLNFVDASAVFANTSTRFNDGFEFGLGAEVAVSTSKLHARGPMGLESITSYKWKVVGNGQIRI